MPRRVKLQSFPPQEMESHVREVFSSLVPEFGRVYLPDLEDQNRLVDAFMERMWYRLNVMELLPDAPTR